MVAMVTPERADVFGAAFKKTTDEANAKVAWMKKEAEEAKVIVTEFEGPDTKNLPDEESRRFNGACKKIELVDKVAASAPVSVKADKTKKQQQQKKGAKAAPHVQTMVTVMSMNLSPFAIQKYITPALEALDFQQ